MSAKWGIYSTQAMRRCFPVQLCEALSAIAIGIIVMKLAAKKDYKPDGTLYPIMLIMYGGARFIWEFYSASERVFLGITELGLWALATAVIGTVWLGSLSSAKNKKMIKTTTQ